ncbi:MAG: class I tRNA ligase family protein, partial [Candidatus Saccharicenans sp.]
ASRFVLMNLSQEPLQVDSGSLSLPNRWIRSRLVRVSRQLSASLKDYKFYEAAETIYHFIWHEFCDWYIEFIKPELRQGNKKTQAVMEDTLEKIMRLLHPFMPFITEEIWHHLPGTGQSLLEAEWPVLPEDWLDEEAELAMKFLQEIISEIRTIRAENRLPVREKVNLWISGGQKNIKLTEPYEDAVKLLAGVETINYVEELPSDKKLLKGVAGTTEIGILVARSIDLDQERERLEKELVRAKEDITKLEIRLNNPDFLGKAPAAVVEDHRSRLAELKLKKEKLEKGLQELAKK